MQRVSFHALSYQRVDFSRVHLSSDCRLEQPQRFTSRAATSEVFHQCSAGVPEALADQFCDFMQDLDRQAGSMVGKAGKFFAG